MSEDKSIRDIFCCLEALFSKEADVKDDQEFNASKDTRNHELKKKVHAVQEKIENYPEIRENIVALVQACSEEKCSCDHITFLQMCLVLLRLLQKALSQETDTACSSLRDGGKFKLLSMSEQNTLKKCFEFIVGLGILPNLVRGIGVPLSSRLRNPNVFENFSNGSTYYQKHNQLVACLDTMLNCLECDAMKSFLFNCHETYLLAALLQLCHAPIKRVEKSEMTVITAPPSDEIEFQSILVAMKDNSDHSQWQIVSLIFLHRPYFKKCLEKFLNKMSRSFLMWEFLLFLSIPIQSDHFSKRKIARYPNWMKKICHEMLMQLLLQNRGIVSLIQAIFVNGFGADVENDKLDVKQVEAIAFTITHLVQDDNLENFVQKISNQVFQLLHLKESPLNQPLKFTAVCIILQLYERNEKLGIDYFFQKILDPLLKCFNHHDDDAAKVIVEETDLTKCIENLHEIFTSAPLPLTIKSIEILFPFFHCLSTLYLFLVKGTSFLKCKVKDLLIEILNAASDTDAVTLLSAVAIPPYKDQHEHPITVSFAYGDEGGAIAIHENKTSNTTDEIFCYKSLLDLIRELHNKDLNSAFILQIMKEYCNFHLKAKVYPYDVNLKTQSEFSALLQELSEWNVDIGAAFASNISEVMSLIMDLLENMINNHSDDSFREESAMVVLMTLSSLLTCENHVLSSDDWKCIKKCLPNLQKLQKCDFDLILKEMLMHVTTLIATQGASGMNESDSVTEFLKNCSDLENRMFGSNPENNATRTFKTLEDSNQNISNMQEEVESQTECNLNECAEVSDFQTHCPKEKDALKHDPKRTLRGDCANNSKTLDAHECSNYERAVKEANNKDIPIQGHGLINLGKLIQERDKETIMNKSKIFVLFQECIKHEDSYVYLSAIQGISNLAELDTELVLPSLLKMYQNLNENCEVVLKIGEVLLKICRLLGDTIHKYRDQLLYAYLVVSKNSHPQIRASSLSNLGEVCMFLKFNICPNLQEILECVSSLLKTDEDLEVRRCSVMVISLLLRGMGKDMLQILPSDIYEIYRLLKFIRDVESDEVLCLHSDLAIQEINSNMKDFFNPSSLLTKEIKILP